MTSDTRLRLEVFILKYNQGCSLVNIVRGQEYCPMGENKIEFLGHKYNFVGSIKLTKKRKLRFYKHRDFINIKGKANSKFYRSYLVSSNGFVYLNFEAPKFITEDFKKEVGESYVCCLRYKLNQILAK